MLRARSRSDRTEYRGGRHPRRRTGYATRIRRTEGDVRYRFAQWEDTVPSGVGTHPEADESGVRTVQPKL